MATLTVYPEAGTGSTSCDGQVYRGSAVNETFATIRAGDGTTAETTPAHDALGEFLASTTSNQYNRLRRELFVFDTSALTASASISAATMSINGGVGSSVTGLGDLNIAIVGVPTMAANTSVATSDYQNNASTTTLQSDTTIAFSAWAYAAYNDFAFNATGIGNISKTGVSKFMTRNSADRTNSAPTWSSGAQSTVEANFADTALTTTDPKLVITYTIPSGPANLKTFNGLATASIKTINGLAIASVKSVNGMT